jgi:histidinol-phosphatase
VTDDEADLKLALALADIADGITADAFRRADLVVETKADRTPVTDADRGVELAIREEIAGSRPDDRIVGEEFGDSGAALEGKSTRRWIIDPIDGTKNFVRRIPVWATLLALEVEGEVRVGVVSAPALGRRWWAARGEGAFAADRDAAATRIEVSKVRDLSDAYVTGNSVPSWGDGGRGFVDLAGRCAWDRNLGDFWSHMLVAEGACDVGLDPVVSVWDLAAVEVVVEEAGGKFTSLEGLPGPDGGSAVSTNGLLHDEVLAILNGRG